MATCTLYEIDLSRVPHLIPTKKKQRDSRLVGIISTVMSTEVSYCILDVPALPESFAQKRVRQLEGKLRHVHKLTGTLRLDRGPSWRRGSCTVLSAGTGNEKRRRASRCCTASAIPSRLPPRTDARSGADAARRVSSVCIASTHDRIGTSETTGIVERVSPRSTGGPVAVAGGTRRACSAGPGAALVSGGITSITVHADGGAVSGAVIPVHCLPAPEIYECWRLIRDASHALAWSIGSTRKYLGDKPQISIGGESLDHKGIDKHGDVLSRVVGYAHGVLV